MTTVVTIDWTDVIALAPELATVSVAGQDEILAQVALEVVVGGWGSLAAANAGATWLARHLATMNGKGGSGQVTSVTVGQVSKTFASATSLEALQSTRYGMEYLRLARKFKPRFALLR